MRNFLWRQPPARAVFGIPKEAGTPISSYTTDAEIKAHPDYRAAKAGDVEATARLIPDVVKPGTIEEARRRFGSDVLYVPVIAEEANGHNAIPEGLSHYYAAETGAEVTEDISQTSRAFHTGARPMERIMARPIFSGPVERGRRYVLVDDVTVLGGTLAELANHIRAGGGEVAGVVTLVNASRGGILTPTPQRIRLLENRFGDEIRTLGIEPAALTGPEAAYLAGFRDAERLRATVAKAEGERERRLLQKGIRQEGDDRLSLLSAPVNPRFAPDADRLGAALQARLKKLGIADRVALRLVEDLEAERARAHKTGVQ